ncbi:MAG TPA: CBS domain-containing protein [Acidobacteriota bacterium]|nr:CBS domain-containing protein [Acidobacteriota bacterium]
MRDIQAHELMNREVIKIRDDMTLRAAASLLSANSISGAPVIDDEDCAVGVISFSDIAAHAAEGSESYTLESSDYLQGWEDRLNAEDLDDLQIEDSGSLVRDVMTPTVYTVPHDTPVKYIARAMIAGRVHRLFVTEGDSIAGIITTLDLLRILARDEDDG